MHAQGWRLLETFYVSADWTEATWELAAALCVQTWKGDVNAVPLSQTKKPPVVVARVQEAAVPAFNAAAEDLRAEVSSAYIWVYEGLGPYGVCTVNLAIALLLINFHTCSPNAQYAYMRLHFFQYRIGAVS